MKFNRRALLGKVNASLTAEENRLKKIYDENNRKYEAAEKAWFESKKPGILKEAAQGVIKKVNAGKLVTYSDLEAFRSYSHAFGYSRPKPDELCSMKLQFLQELKGFLELIEDDEVSTAGLNSAGFRGIGKYVTETSCG